MRIKKYQTGGLTYIPTQQVWEDSESSHTSLSNFSDEKSEKKDSLAKDFIDIIKENGLPSDVELFLGKVQMMLNNKSGIFSNNNDLSMRDIIQAQILANRVKSNNELYESVEKHLDAENAWSEIATDVRGNLYVQDKNSEKIVNITPKEYSKNQGKYIPITNKDLIEIRKNDINYAYRSDILTDAGSAVSTKTVINYIKDAIKEFGTTEITGYSEKKNSEIRSGMEHIISGDIGDMRELFVKGPGGYYKISSSTTVADSNIEAAVSHLISILPQSYKNVLTAKSAVEGYDSEAMVLRMIYTNTSRKAEVDYDGNTNKVNSDGTSKEDLIDADYLTNIADYDFGERSNIILRPGFSNPNDVSEIKTVGWKKGAVVDDKGNILSERYNLKLLKSKAEAFLAGDTSSISFGNRIVNPEDLEKIVWDGSSEIIVVELPYKIEEGKKIPDLKAIKEIDDLNKWKQDYQPSQLEINERIKKIELNNQVSWDEKSHTFKFKDSALMPFIQLVGVTNGKTYDAAKEIYDEGWLEKIDKATGKEMVDWYDNAVQFGKEYPNKNDYQNESMKDAKSGRFYKGNIFIPIENALIALNMSRKVHRKIPKDFTVNPSEKYEITKNTIMSRESAEEKDRIENRTFNKNF